MAICINPAILIETSEKYNQAKSLLSYWGAKYSTGFNPNHYKVGEELPILNKQGVLKFNWTEKLNDYDFIIATATKPEIDRYPTSKNIADRMIVKIKFYNIIFFVIFSLENKEIEKCL